MTTIKAVLIDAAGESYQLIDLIPNDLDAKKKAINPNGEVNSSYSICNGDLFATFKNFSEEAEVNRPGLFTLKRLGLYPSQVPCGPILIIGFEDYKEASFPESKLEKVRTSLN